MADGADKQWLDSYRVDPERGVVIGPKGRPLSKKANGYIWISRPNKQNYSAHRLIWERVHGPVPEGMQINHINGNKLDNRIANLEVVTPSRNTLHAYELGLACAKGEKNGRSIGKRRRLQGMSS